MKKLILAGAYATGGPAAGHVKGTTSTTPLLFNGASACASNAFCSAGSGSKTLIGWTVGAGAEHSFASGWSAKIEYLYYDLGKFSYPTNEISSAFPASLGVPTMNMDSSVTGHIVRAGLNYKFASP